MSCTALVVVLLAGCTGSSTSLSGPLEQPGSGVQATSSPSGAAPTLASPTPPALPEKKPPTHGDPSDMCTKGWTTPQRTTSFYTDPIGLIRRATGVQGPLEIVDMRYFTGPESPPSDKGYILEVQRWYIKLYAKNDIAFQGRFLVEARRFGRGLVAVAPYDTTGLRSPDWRAFQYDESDATPRVVPGLPGTWTGIEYDFVEGGAGLTIPGLPAENAGCLDGT